MLRGSLVRCAAAKNRLRHASITTTAAAAAAAASALIQTTSKNGVTTIVMNNPKRLNGWTEGMMRGMFDAFDGAAADDATKVVVLTGADPYYCAGVSLADTIRPMHPRAAFEMIVTQNQRLFDSFLDFPKPIIAAVNGPGIGASVTSATLCDAIVASERATFSTPFARLGVPAEGCSSYWFAEIMGEENAGRMLGAEGWQPTAAEAVDAGFVLYTSVHEELLDDAQTLGEVWIAEGKHTRRTVNGRAAGESNELIATLKAVNAAESLQLGAAFLSPPFLHGQETFLRSKGKTAPALMFGVLRGLRPLWWPLVGDVTTL